MGRIYSYSKSYVKIDWVLCMALTIGFVFCLYGISWPQGHPDDMAFRTIFIDGKKPFNPGWFHKPPFHTYFNYFLSNLPIDVLDRLFDFPSDSLDHIKTIWSRVLTSFLFLFSVVIVYKIIAKSFGVFPARMAAWIFATSAGFSAYSHFLTTDIPVMFWMLLAFYFSFKILFQAKISIYLLAGFFTGISTATKYNGLAVGISLAVAHFLSCYSSLWKDFELKRLVFDKRIYLGLFMVPVGFIVGNPYSILDFATFKNDFIYNYTVTPVYDGETGTSYLTFFWHLTEVIGIPCSLLCGVGMAYSLYLIIRSSLNDVQQKTVLLSLSVLLLYYYKFGAFPRLETRFILPLVPFLFIGLGTLWQSQVKFKKVLLVFFFLIIGYNIACNIYVGKRFLGDPRSDLYNWAQNKIPDSSKIEMDIYTPSFAVPNNKKIEEIIAPNVSGRERIFASVFKDNSFILGSEIERVKEEMEVDWYSEENLKKRNPDFIALNSLYYTRFTHPGIKQNLYPTINTYFQQLLAQKLPYKIILDKESKEVPVWVYPTEIDFLHNRVTVLQRN